MSIESAKAYVERLKTDKGFATAAEAVKTEEQAWAFIAEQGFDFTSAELESALPHELSTRELEGVVGGQSKKSCPMCLLSTTMLVTSMP
jgi:predicted ribosomally synthesized peptide with nif11-like leader